MKIGYRATGEAFRLQLTALAVLVLLFGLAFGVSFGLKHPLFWQWDKLVHFIAGAAIAVLFRPYYRGAKIPILWVLVVGVIFEIVENRFVPAYEYGGLYPYAVDTFFDVAVEIFGAWIVLKILHRFRHG